MSQAAYARHRQVARETVRRAVRDGRIPVDAKGRIDPKEADKRWELNTDLAKERPAKPKGKKRKLGGRASQSFAESRARREEIRAQLADLELLERRGSLVPITEVRDAVFSLTRRARDLLRAIPDRTASIVAGLTEEVACHKVLSEEIERVQAELAGLEARVGAAADAGAGAAA